MSVRILEGDCREVLRTLPDASVHCCVTSPPYFGLRDYGCDGQMGLEPTPEEFIAGMVEVFGEVRRVLRDDGTLWLNIGDSYASTGGQSPQSGPLFKGRARQRENICTSNRGLYEGVKAKDLIGIPWMLAFALRADGWFLRQDIIWAKPNPMPESVTDRCTKSHEYLFLLSKSARYYFNADAIKEEAVSLAPSGNGFAGRQGGSDHLPMSGGEGTRERWEPKKKVRSPAGWKTGPGAHGSIHENGRELEVSYTETEQTNRNKRSVWMIGTQPFKEAHFATFPPALVEPCILAGCQAGGTVLDPFGGAGTTGLVADRLQRDAILIELSPDYAEMARRRITGDSPLFAEVA